ncbi:PAS domain S-box protein [Pelobacter propionicus]|uniref:histidine kinase n=1 Tax=Pelobacter propionicus (strain DSM 2379 / NBRC 103807 / OttBd1) TaxID=338966 RepID=A1AQJ1_PELPD|nr:PAS domain S-box protein [Pelobacter propionicus]ABK99611.1 PAS/PAC sensor signal transduction histidine kinase [Pelobacter propionicus DSM 2379]
MDASRNSGCSSPKQLMHSILQAIPDLISVVDTDFKIVYSNWRGGHEYAAPNRRKQNRHCYEVYYPDLNGRCDPCHLVQVFETGMSIVAEKFNPRVGYLEIHAFPIFDASGTVVMAGEYLRNISDRKHAEDALRGANQMLEALVNASPPAILTLDLDLNLTLWNPAAERMFGWKIDEVLGKSYPIVSIELMEELKENIRRLNRGEERQSMETRRLHRDGHFIDVSLSTAPMLNSEGGTIGYVAIMADISERKQAQQALRESEANYRAIFDAANDATFVFDVETGAMLDVNLKMCQMYGYLREEVLLLNVEQLSAGFPPYTFQDLMKLIWKTKRDQSHLFEWLAKDRSGRLFWVEVNMKGAVIGGEYKVLAVVRDISARKAAEEENRIMQERLLQANKMAAIGTLASGIAHEINNPNNYILSNAQFLSDIWPEINRVLTRYAEENGEFFLGKLGYGEAAAMIPKMLTGLTEGAYRIKGIVTGLKDFARQEKTRLDKPVDINKVIEAALSMLHNKIKQHTDNFSCSLDKALPPVRGRFRQLEQVIVNLTMNALESLPSRDRAVSIQTSYSQYLEQITIRVEDQGIGMTEEVQKAIFDPFFTTKLDRGGTGLGLSINFTIVKEHNGIIECDSSPGKGTVFYVRIPALRFEPEENGLP